MLVITRKEGERLMIGDDIVIQVVEIDRGKVRIGIEAPRSVRVLREEIVERKKPEGEERSESNNP